MKGDPEDERRHILDSENCEQLLVPRSKSKPVNLYQVPGGEESAFPWLFPTGENGYRPVNAEGETWERTKKINPSMYWRTRLFSIDERWRKDVTYLLHAAVSYDLMLLNSELSTHMNMHKKRGDKKDILIMLLLLT